MPTAPDPSLTLRARPDPAHTSPKRQRGVRGLRARLATRTALCATLAATVSCTTPPPPHAWTTLAPGLRLSTSTRVVEFDATVAVDVHDPATPDVYLELVACTPDTREHESLVVTDVRPSLIHAALLSLGVTPGSPGRVSPQDQTRRDPPTGDAVRVELEVDHRAVSPAAWITDSATRSARPDDSWVFAGSRIVNRGGRTLYDADGSGTLIGLATFGGETIAYARVISPEASVDEPTWIADPRAVPPRGTPVRVRLGAAN